ncbi:hypothetical protein Tco_1564370 [Tanacetum coccineum]
MSCLNNHVEETDGGSSDGDSISKLLLTSSLERPDAVTRNYDAVSSHYMSLSPHSTITSSEFDMENAFSTMNIHNYTSALSATSGSTSFKDSRNDMILQKFSLFYYNPYLKDVQAFYAKESPISPSDPIAPPVVLTPSPILSPSLLFDPQYFFVPEKLLPLKQ